ncbi:hypothetical protein ABMA27_013877 [Loxostege sticticalis]|uniref:Integrase catalytic domain-containing protein n=1 Tax=Loxostege sticticalis TaxID=481309 RepID=A0ABR3IBT8_LOXSC
MLEARHFTIYTDHKPLCFAFHERKNNCSPRQFRHLDYIAQFSTDIRHIAGKDNVVADTLSRVEELQKPIDLEELAKSQTSDPELEQILHGSTSLHLEKKTIPGSRLLLYCDVSTPTPRPFVTEQFRHQVFLNLHSFTRFKYVHLDLIGPLPPSAGYRYCLTAVDRFTRWPEVVPLSEITAEAVAKAFISGWISRYGCPTDIVTDRGRQFQSALFEQLAKLIGFRHRMTTAYHPQCNGLVERFHRQLKTAITCHSDVNWTETLPLVLLGIRNAFKEDLQATPSELLYGETLRMPGEFFGDKSDCHTTDIRDFSARLRTFANALKPVPTSNHHNSKIFVYKELATSSHVFVRDDTVRGTFQPAYNGPFEVMTRGPKTFKIKIKNKTVTVSIDRLKPAYTLSDKNLNSKLNKSKIENTSTKNKKSFDNILTNNNNKETLKATPKTVTTRSGRRVRFPDYYRP